MAKTNFASSSEPASCCVVDGFNYITQGGAASLEALRVFMKGSFERAKSKSGRKGI